VKFIDPSPAGTGVADRSILSRFRNIPAPEPAFQPPAQPRFIARFSGHPSKKLKDSRSGSPISGFPAAQIPPLPRAGKMGGMLPKFGGWPPSPLRNSPYACVQPFSKLIEQQRDFFYLSAFSPPPFSVSRPARLPASFPIIP